MTSRVFTSNARPFTAPVEARVERVYASGIVVA